LAQTSLAMLQFPANPLRYRVGFGLAVLLPFVVATLTALITRGAGEFQNRGAEICLMTIMAVSWLPFVFLLRLPRWKRILFAAVSVWKLPSLIQASARLAPEQKSTEDDEEDVRQPLDVMSSEVETSLTIFSID